MTYFTTELKSILIFVIASLVLSLILFVAVYIMSFTSKVEFEKSSAYECGFSPFSETQYPFEIQFAVIAIMFLLFDIEVLYLYPLVTSILDLNLYDLISLLAFFIILTSGIVFEISRQIMAMNSIVIKPSSVKEVNDPSVKTMKNLFNNMRINYIKYNMLYQIIFYLLIAYITKGVIELYIYIPIVSAETLIDFLPRQDQHPYQDSFDHPVTFSGAGIPHGLTDATNNVVIDEKPDGNITCEDAAYNQRDPLTKETEANVKAPKLQFEELMTQKVILLNEISQRTIKILEEATSVETVDKNMVPFTSIKNATFTALTNYEPIKNWAAKTHNDILNSNHEANLRLAVIQTIIENKEKLHPIEREIIYHLAASITLINTANALDIDITDPKFQQLFTSNLYMETFKKYNV